MLRHNAFVFVLISIDVLELKRMRFAYLLSTLFLQLKLGTEPCVELKRYTMNEADPIIPHKIQNILKFISSKAKVK